MKPTPVSIFLRKDTELDVVIIKNVLKIRTADMNKLIYIVLISNLLVSIFYETCANIIIVNSI